MIKIKLVLISLIFLATAFVYNAEAAENMVAPHVDIVSSGPIKWGYDKDSNAKGVRYRIVITLSEVYHYIYIQELNYGDEGCCVEVIRTFQIDIEKNLEKRYFYGISDIQWIDYKSLSFIGDSNKYMLNNLDGKYQVEKVK